jgi:hypothetical protein
VLSESDIQASTRIMVQAVNCKDSSEIRPMLNDIRSRIQEFSAIELVTALRATYSYQPVVAEHALLLAEAKEFLLKTEDPDRVRSLFRGLDQKYSGMRNRQ